MFGKTQSCYGGVKYLNGLGPSMRNVALLDGNARPLIQLMGRTGMIVDLAHFSKMEVELNQDLERLTEEVRDITGHYINLGSGDMKSDLLFKKLGLKQARRVMTTSGSRESVENEVLVAMQHQHPVVGLMLEYAELDKLRGTYVVPMPRLARRTKFGEWRMFPNITTTRVVTGRYAAKEPNLLAMPSRTEKGRDIRKGFIPRPGWVYISCDMCLHPDTKVETLRGSKKISEIEIGEPILTYREGQIKYGRLTRSVSVHKKLAYKVTFDNGESVIASHDHRWPTQQRQRRGKSQQVVKITRDLKPGDSMLACRESLNDGHKTWYSHSNRVYTVQHRLVAEAFLGPLPFEHHTHHKNGNPGDNRPENLEYLPIPEHVSRHSKESYKTQDHTYRVFRLRQGLQKRRSYNGTANPNSRLSEAQHGAIRRLIVEDNFSARDIADYFGIEYSYARDLVLRHLGNKNHKVVSVEPVGFQPMHSITVEPDHNYVLSCGVVTMNSQIEPRVAAHRSKDTNLLKVYWENQDIYSDFATPAFKLEDKRYLGEDGVWKYPTVDKIKHRYPAKTCVLASIYEVTNTGLLEQMPVICHNCGKESKEHTHEHSCKNFVSEWHEDNCQDLINAFYIRYEGLIRMRKEDNRRALAKGFLWDDFGRILHTTAVRSVHPWVVSAALREASNMPIQGTSAGILKLATAKFYSYLESNNYSLLDVLEPHLPIHDELLVSAREDVAEEIGELIADCFCSTVKLDVEIKAEYATAESWGHLKK